MQLNSHELRVEGEHWSGPVEGAKKCKPPSQKRLRRLFARTGMGPRNHQTRDTLMPEMIESAKVWAVGDVARLAR
ncbi:MAG: hypothetical protein SGPRY_006243 [Prymnesium sp.]